MCRDDNIDEEEREEEKVKILPSDDDIETIQDHLAKRCISQDFISEMREAFHLFDKVRGDTNIVILQNQIIHC